MQLTGEEHGHLIGSYRRTITSIWWVGGGVLILSMIWLGSRPGLTETMQEPLGWLLPHVIPTMTLTGAVAYFGGRPPVTGGEKQDIQFLFRLAAGTSLVYFGVLVFVILTVTGNTVAGTIMSQFPTWNVALGLLQGLPASAVGVFFARN